MPVGCFLYKSAITPNWGKVSYTEGVEVLLHLCWNTDYIWSLFSHFTYSPPIRSPCWAGIWCPLCMNDSYQKNHSFSFVFMSFSSWPSMDPDMGSDWLLLLTILSAKIGFRLLKGTMWAVAFLPWLGDLSDAFSRTGLLCSKAQRVTLCLFLFPLEGSFGCRSDGRKDISWHTKTC